MPANPTRIRDVFLAAVDLPPEERPGYLAEACRDDADLRAEVDRLLSADAQPDSILEAPSLRAPTDVTGAFVPDSKSPEYAPTAAFESHEATSTFGDPSRVAVRGRATSSAIGAIIARRYTLVAVIGEGGMGAVYLASQTEPVKRQVALKLIKAGMDTKTVLARFDAERQALAVMDHPNIARVYDGGTTEHGEPFFVMELVKGVPLTEYCDTHRLSVKARLELFVSVCQAVQHAHQKGIIHRDLKPGNVLVTEIDGRPTPKVIDFGVAKATELKLTDLSLADAGMIVGTPAYMSPEQADPGCVDIDTRTDVYALGVMLYELLTGSPPIDAKQFRRGAMLEMLRMVREVEPPRPSTKLSTADALPNIAANRDIEPAKLAKLLQGELDWVVMKALEKDRALRYETANGLARDIQRYLADEEVEARPPSASYRLRKFVRRHKRRVFAASLVLLTLVAGIVVSTYFAVLAGKEAAAARTAEGDARKAEATADSEAKTARAAEGEANRQRDRAEQARIEADNHRDMLRLERDQSRQSLYFAEMTLAGIHAEAPGGLGRVQELLNHWGAASDGADLRGWEWYYLDSQSRQAALTLRGHSRTVRAVAYSSDSTRLASGGDDSTVRIWDTATGREIACFRGHTSTVNGLAWSPDGTCLATASKDGTVRVWDVASGKELRTLCTLGVEVTAVAWRPDGERVAATGYDFQLHVWDVDSGREVVNARVGGDWGMALAWSPDGKQLAHGSWGHAAFILDSETGAKLATLPGNTGGVLGVCWSPTGDRLATASWDKTVRIWDSMTGKERAVLTGAEFYLYAVGWSPDGKQIAAGGGNRAVHTWDAETGQPRSVLRGNLGDVRALAWHPDSSSLAATSQEGAIRIWNLRPPGPDQVRPKWTDDKFSPDRTKTAVCGNDNKVRISSVATGELLLTIEDLPGTPYRTRWSPDGNLIACSGWGWALGVWDARTGRRLFLTERTKAGRHFALAWSPSGDRIATSGDFKAITMWDPASGRKQCEIPKTHDVWDLSWRPDGRQIAAAHWDGLATISDASGASVLTLRGHSGRVMSVGWSPDGKRIATGSYDRTVKLWDAATGRETITLRGHGATVREIYWRPDGCQLATKGESGPLVFWDATPAYLAERSAPNLQMLGDRLRGEPADATSRRLRAEVLARQGDWNAAAAEFAEQEKRSASVVYPAGWWALPGTDDRPPTFPTSAKDIDERWLAPADDPNGFIALPADGTTVVCRLFAPQRKLVILDIGLVPHRLWLNEKALDIANSGMILVELHDGWNSLALRGGSKPRYVRWRDLDKPGDSTQRLAFVRAAARVLAGQTKLELPLDERAKLRQRALEWLKTELSVWDKLLAADASQVRAAVAKSLGEWRTDVDFAEIRDAAALAKLPADEQKAFIQLWTDVAVLAKKCEEKTTPASGPPPREQK